MRYAYFLFMMKLAEAGIKNTFLLIHSQQISTEITKANLRKNTSTPLAIPHPTHAKKHSQK